MRPRDGSRRDSSGYNRRHARRATRRGRFLGLRGCRSWRSGAGRYDCRYLVHLSSHRRLRGSCLGRLLLLLLLLFSSFTGVSIVQFVRVVPLVGGRRAGRLLLGLIAATVPRTNCVGNAVTKMCRRPLLLLDSLLLLQLLLLLLLHVVLLLLLDGGATHVDRTSDR